MISLRQDGSERKGDWIQTWLGVQFWPMDPRAEEVRLGDIAHALSYLCRFGGHTNGFYSVAQHSCIVADNLPFNLAPHGLMHDATEAYLIDVPSPIKKYLTEYKGIEQRLAQVIGQRFGLMLEPLPKKVHVADQRALWTEKRDVKGPQPARWNVPVLEAFPEPITPWSQERAEWEFLSRARQLGLR